MFAEIIEYEDAITEICDYNLDESQINTLIRIIRENPTLSASKLIEITSDLFDNKQIILDSGTYSIDPILNESQTNLLEIAIPTITKYIPLEIIGYLTETHVKVITDKILDVEFDETTTPQELTQRIDEIFNSGDISIPVQGLRRRPASANVVLGGTFTQRLHKGIQFGDEFEKPLKSHSSNKKILRNALEDFNMISIDDETPLMKILPKLIMKLKNLVGDMVDVK